MPTILTFKSPDWAGHRLLSPTVLKEVTEEAL